LVSIPDNPILVAVLSTIALAVLGWIASKVRDAWDRARVRRWLRANTRDEPHQSHVDTIKLAKATRLPEDRIRRACMSDERFHGAPGDIDLWSVWCLEPRSIYEKRGIIDVEIQQQNNTIEAL
jgi:hypothetical protein